MILSFKQYIDNPMGKQNSVYRHRDMYKTLYTEKWNKIILREAGKIDYKLFKNLKKEIYYIYIRIPSEVVPKFTYDVVIEFRKEQEQERFVTTNLDNYAVRFFSNDPAFIYTFAYVFNDNDLFIKELASKVSKRSLREKPTTTNTKEIIGYVKSLYFAYLYMKQKNLFSKLIYDIEATEISFRDLMRKIEHSDSKILRRQQLGEEEARKKRLVSKPVPSKPTDTRSQPKPISIATRRTKNTRAVNRVSNIAGSNRVKATKRI